MGARIDRRRREAAEGEGTRGLDRRRFLAAALRSLALVLASPSLVAAQERVRSIHQATRNTVLGAVGVALRQAFGGRPPSFKPYPERPRTALPAAETAPASDLSAVLSAIRPARAFSSEPISLPMLVRLLEAANGVTGQGPSGIALRAAPSAGALYAGELYVVVEKVEGLSSGLYYYAPLSRELVGLRKGSLLDEVNGALEDPVHGSGSAVAVLITSVFPRYRWRYANRGYRYALIDAGHIGQNLVLSAASAGLADWSPTRFHDDRLNALVGVDGIDEAVCAVHLIGTREDARTQGDRAHRLVEADVAGRPLPAAADDAPERYHARTRLVPAAEGGRAEVDASGAEASGGKAAGATKSTRAKRTPPVEDDSGAGDETGEVIRLSASEQERPSAPSVEQAIRRRRSARTFAPSPIDPESLRDVLAAAIGPDSLRAAPVSLFVFVHRGEDLAPGLYRARLGEGRGVELQLTRSGDLSERLVDVCLGQDKAGQAAVGIAMVGDLEAAAIAGDRGYRDLCLEAGAIGQRIYLAAESVGLAARNLSAFVDARLDELVGLDGQRRAVVHLTMLGPGD